MEQLSPTNSLSAARRQSRSGFTLPEVIVGVVLLGLFLLMCIGMVRAGKRLLPGTALSVEGEVLPIAPSPAAFADSVKLHGALMERLNAARAVYVLGGSHEGLPTAASRLSGAPLAATALPVIGSFAAGLPTDAYAFHKAYASQLGPMATAATPADFSVVVIGPWNNQLAVTALIQVREKPVALDDASLPQNWVRRETQLYDVSGDTWKCTFLEKASVASAASIGARHFWYRYEEGRVAEEGPVMTVFPDPCLYAGTRGVAHDEPPLFSRFTYFLSVNP